MNEINIRDEQISNTEALQYKPGTIFRVPWDGHDKIYMRTDIDDWPFIDLKDGSASGKGGVFKLIPTTLTTITIT